MYICVTPLRSYDDIYRIIIIYYSQLYFVSLLNNYRWKRKQKAYHLSPPPPPPPPPPPHPHLLV